MPINKAVNRISRVHFIDVLRSAFLTVEDSLSIYEGMRRMVLEALVERKIVSVLGLVTIKVVRRKEKFIPGAFGGEDAVFPSKLVLRATIYPKLQREWLEELDSHPEWDDEV